MLKILTSEETKLLIDILEEAMDLASENYETTLMVRITEASTILNHLQGYKAEDIIK